MSAIVRLQRRALILGTAALLMPPTLQSEALAQAKARLVVTPGQTEGPFYPVSYPADMDTDLVRVQGRAADAMGQVTHIAGQVLDTRGEPVRGAMVEIWQCDANGIYNHPDQPGLQRRDVAFQGYGRTAVGADGRYRFRTIRPVPYPGRTPHIHFKVHAPGVGLLTTQMYIAGERGNSIDIPLNAIRDRAQRERVIVPLIPAGDLEPGALSGTFDIVLAI